MPVDQIREDAKRFMRAYQREQDPKLKEAYRDDAIALFRLAISIEGARRSQDEQTDQS